MFYDMKDVLVGANCKVKIIEVMELVSMLGLKNKNKGKVNANVVDIFEGKSQTGEKGQG